MVEAVMVLAVLVTAAEAGTVAVATAVVEWAVAAKALHTPS